MTQTDASQSRAGDLLARDPACQRAGIELEEVGPGSARLRMRVADGMLNGHGVAHGGYVFLLADAAFACASNSYGPVALAQSAQITFLRPATAGEELLAVAAERERHGRVGLYDVTVRGGDGAVIAEFRGQSALIAGARSLHHAEPGGSKNP